MDGCIRWFLNAWLDGRDDPWMHAVLFVLSDVGYSLCPRWIIGRIDGYMDVWVAAGMDGWMAARVI